MTESNNVAEFSGETKTYTRQGDSGGNVHYEFCPECASTLRWKVDVIPNREAFAAGAFDDIDSLNISGEIYADSSAPWVTLGCALSKPHAPDDDFRKALIEKSKALR